MLSICLAYALSVFDDDEFCNDLILFLLTIVYNRTTFIIFDYFGVLVDKKMTCRKSIKKAYACICSAYAPLFFKEKKDYSRRDITQNALGAIWVGAIWLSVVGCRLSKTTRQLNNWYHF